MVHPRLGKIDEQEIIEILKHEFKKRNSRVAFLMMEMRDQSNSIRVKRSAPILTKEGKFYPYSFGNVRSKPLLDILNRMWSHSMFQLSKQEQGCFVMDKKFRSKYIERINSEEELPIRL